MIAARDLAARSLAFVLALVVVGGAGCAGRQRGHADADRADAGTAASAASGRAHQFTFAWPFASGDAMAPRGGTSHGPAVELDESPSPGWKRLAEPGLGARERDRRAMLAMAGTFRTSFDFLEVVGFRPGFTPDRPYQSWGTEYVYVVHDEPDYVALQHVLVMFMKTKEGDVQGPFVVKHWRQDWRYQDRDLLTYRGRLTWAKQRLTAEQATGTWTQAVFQVDDSPRYEAYGRWQHFGNVSSWLSSTTWRPLPRREFSVRKDYDVLVGTNRVTITPTGWVHLEENLKVALAAPGKPRSDSPVLAEELGFNRYERLRGFDDAAGRRYAERTQPFWNEVRTAWDALANERRPLVLRAAPDQAQLFVPLFEYAGRLDEGAPFDRDDARAFARKTVRSYLAGSEPTAAAGAMSH
jgi:hypothetical protein